MKKLTYTLMFLAMFGFMAACGGGESDTETEETSDSTSTEETTSTEAEEENTQAVDDEESEAALNSETAQKLARKWQMIAYSHTDGRSEEGLEGDFLVLNADGSFSEVFKGKEVASGKWSLSEDEKQLILKHETGEFLGKESKMTIQEVSAEKLVTVDDEGKMTETFVAAPETDA